VAFPLGKVFLFAHSFLPSQSAKGQGEGQKDNIMRTKKETRSLLPGVRRLLKLLAEAHPMVIVTTPAREKYDERGLQPSRD
jgi:hypothetical protein